MSRIDIEKLYGHSSEIERYSREIGEPTKLGEALTIVGHPFAEKVNNEELLMLALKTGLPESEIENAKKSIANTGFTHRYVSHFPEKEANFEGVFERTTTIGAILLREVMKANNWDDIDVFIDTSAFLPITINEGVLEKAGLNPDKVWGRSYRYACAGAVGALIDCLSDPSLHGARVVIGALEPVSQIYCEDHFNVADKLTLPSIFGDANTFMALRPERFSLENKRILVQPDGGVIKVPTLYNFQAVPSDPQSIPDHYRFINGGEKVFRYSEKGAFLDIEQPPAGKHTSMDGMATGFFFGDQTTNLISELLLENGNLELLKQLGGKNVVLHPASKPVVDRIAKLLKRSENKYLDTPELPFLMDKAQHSNSSSATALNRWRYMIENDMMDPSLPVFWIAPGIGSAIAGAIGTIKW